MLGPSPSDHDHQRRDDQADHPAADGPELGPLRPQQLREAVRPALARSVRRYRGGHRVTLRVRRRAELDRVPGQLQVGLFKRGPVGATLGERDAVAGEQRHDPFGGQAGDRSACPAPCAATWPRHARGVRPPRPAPWCAA